MEALNPQLLEVYTAHYKPGIIGMVGARDMIGMAVREGQRVVTKDGKASL